MTPEQFAENMKIVAERYRGDTEAVHSVADNLLVACLRALGYGDGCDIFDNLPKWYA